MKTPLDHGDRTGTRQRRVSGLALSRSRGRIRATDRWCSRLFALLVAAVGLSSNGHAAAGRPNVVLVLADDLGFSDTGPYGSEIQTPAIDALAAQGLRFSNYHTAASCAPTRGMLLTGVDSHRNGVPNIIEAIPPEQLEHENYRGTLSHDVVTVATLLKDAGYHTYMAGKWHLGMTPDLLPSRRGFERTVAMADTGADNWEKKPYLPIYEKANWFENGREIDLPDDFYSSKFFVDKTIEFIEADRNGAEAGDGSSRPFFAYIPFQAVHIPVQAPQEFTDKYLGVYDAGWSELRERRRVAAAAAGVVPAGAPMQVVPTTQDWAALSPEKRRYESKKMAVYAGMVDAMDHHIGRLVDYLKDINEFDDTVFIFTSDNGSEASQVIGGPGSFLMKWWLARNGYNTDYETLGTRGSFLNIGPSFASAAASPLAYYKFFAHEGGMRVPLIVAGKPVAAKGGVSQAFAWVTDIAPTILDLAGVAPPTARYAGRYVEVPVGKSLLPVLEGRSQRVHSADEAIGYELAGNAALFQGDFKIVKDRGPIGDDTWHLFDIANDPGETRDLRVEMPERFAEMMASYRAYARVNGVLPVPDGYEQRKEVMFYGLRKRVGMGPPTLAAGLFAVLLGLVVWRAVWLRRSRRR